MNGTAVKVGDKKSPDSNVDVNGNQVSVYIFNETTESVPPRDTVDYKDNWIARLLYGGPIGLTVNFTLLTAVTAYFFLTIQDKLKDEAYNEVFKDNWLPTFIGFFTLSLPLDILMHAIILLIVYPLSRLSRSTVYYWIIGVAMMVLMFAAICFKMNSMTVTIRMLTAGDWIRLCMKMAAFLIECNRSEEVFNKSTRKTLLYYLLIPHLVYKTEYPRAHRIRWIKVFSHLWWLGVVAFPYTLEMQYAISGLKVDLLKVDSWQLMKLLFSLELALPIFGYATLVWFFAFENFCGFHGELLRFPDLKLFGDIQDLFKGAECACELNTITSQWLSAYIYIPVVKSGGSRLTGLLCTFAVSQVFHEIFAIYVLEVMMAPSLISVVVGLPTLLHWQTKNKLLQGLIAGACATLVGTHFMTYPLEFIAWNYSSMEGIDQLSKIRLLPLCFIQLYRNFSQ